MDELIKEFEQEHQVKLPKHKEVYPSCRGEGSHVNPAIDGNGICPDDEIAQDPDFWEDYFGGTFDVPCEECKGANVIDVVNEADMAPELRQEWEIHCQAYYDMAAEMAAERRAGC